MQIRKGPYGHYAIERTGNTAQVYEYAEEIINSDTITELLAVYTDDHRDMIEMSFDFSGLISIDEYIQGKGNKHDPLKVLIKRRDSVRAFLVMLSGMTDILMFPCSLCRDHSFIFTDPRGSIVRFCAFPLRYEPEDMSLSVIGEDCIEELLDHRFFTDVLTSDEIQQITFAVSSGNGKMLRETCDGMDNDKWVERYKHHGRSEDSSLPCPELIFGLLCAVTSMYASRIALLPVSVLFLMASVIFICMALSGSNTIHDGIVNIRNGTIRKNRMPEKTNVSKGRREALFDYNNGPISDTMTVSDIPLILRGRTANDGKDIKYGMYSERIIIGSDRFLADLFIDTDDIAPIHAEISRQDGIYYLRPLSAVHHTYLEDRLLEVEHDYELKSGQKLTVGHTELDLTCGFGA